MNGWVWLGGKDPSSPPPHSTFSPFSPFRDFLLLLSPSDPIEGRPEINRRSSPLSFLPLLQFPFFGSAKKNPKKERGTHEMKKWGDYCPLGGGRNVGPASKKSSCRGRFVERAACYTSVGRARVFSGEER